MPSVSGYAPLIHRNSHPNHTLFSKKTTPIGQNPYWWRFFTENIVWKKENGENLGAKWENVLFCVN